MLPRCGKNRPGAARAVRRSCQGALLALLAGAGQAHAGGRYVGDPGAQGAQRAGAFVAKADDATALSFNPAGLVRGRGFSFHLGLNLIRLSMSFARAGTYPDPGGAGQDPGYVGEPYPVVHDASAPLPVPYLAAAFSWGRLALAGGIYAPPVYPSRNFPTQVTTRSGAVAPAPQRYDTIRQDALLALPSLAAAVAVTDALRLGVRLSHGFATLESHNVVQGVASRGEDPGQDVDADITARDGGIFNLGLGVHLALSPRWELGAAYSSAIAIRSRGTARLVLGERLREPIAGGSGSYEVAPVADAVARCAPGGTSQALAACVDVTLPQAASIGLRHIAIDRRSRVRGDIELDLRWEDWSAAGDYRVVIDGQYLGIPIQESRVRHGTSDVFSLRLGGSYRLGNALRHELRAGIGYDGPAAPTSWARIDADSAAHLTASLGAALTLSRIQLALGVTVVDPPDISVAEPGATPTDSARTQPDVLVPTSAADRQPYHPFNSGRHTARYLIGSVGLSAHW